MDSKIFDDKKGIVKNSHGRVDVGKTDGYAPLYVCGWLKRGPTGIIGTNIVDAKDTVQSIIDDLMSGKVHISCSSDDKERGRDGLDVLLEQRNIQKVDWSSYEKIDLQEKDPSRLRSSKQPREKITSVQAMLEIIHKRCNK